MSVLPSEANGPYRPPVLATKEMACASHPMVSAAGMRTLADGGNAIDAALAMAAMSWLALPGQCGVGGDAFAIVREPDGSVWTVNSSGYGPDGGDQAFYAARGLSGLPLEGSLAVAVPGAVAAIASMCERGATRDLSALWADAIETAEHGVACTAKTRHDIASHQDTLAQDPGASRMFLPRGQVPEVGDRLIYPELAATLRTLAKDPADFYTGSLAERAVDALRTSGAPFSGDEWSLAREAAAEPAISHAYGDHVVHQTPLPTPGWMVLQQAAICEGWLHGLAWLDAESIHVMSGAARIAFADRVQRCSTTDDVWRSTLAPAAVSSARERLAFDRAPRGHVTQPDGDTTSMVAVDAEGRAVSFIHSLAFTFGARVSVPETGVLLNNRLARGSYLTPGHPNEVRPRKRPLHTLNAWIATDSRGALRHVGNTPGGDGQVQWNMQVLSHLVDHGRDAQEAVDAPRFTVFPGSDADVLDSEDELQCESRIGAEVLDRLRRRGHPVRVLGPWDAGGSALVVSVDQAKGCLSGGVDSRQEGVALGA